MISGKKSPIPILVPLPIDRLGAARTPVQFSVLPPATHDHADETTPTSSLHRPRSAYTMASLLRRAAPTASHHTRPNPLNPKTRKKTGHQITEPLDLLWYGFIPRRNSRPVYLKARRARCFRSPCPCSDCRLSTIVPRLSSFVLDHPICRLSSHIIPSLVSCLAVLSSSDRSSFSSSLVFPSRRLSTISSSSLVLRLWSVVIPSLIPSLLVLRLPIAHPSPPASRPATETRPTHSTHPTKIPSKVRTLKPKT